MTDEQTDKTRYELLRVIGALQDAFAYAMHAEQIARDAGAKGDGMRIVALRSRINAAIDHAAIIRDSVRA